MIFIKKFPATFFCFFLFFNAVKGQNQALINLAQQEINKRGLTQSEVQIRLNDEGINLNSIAPSEYPKYQKQILSILDKMQKEKEQTKEVPPRTLISPSSQVKVLKVPETTPEEYVAEAKQRELQADSKKNAISNSIYGHSLFTNKSLDLFRTTDGAEAPDNYILGVGDEIRVSIFGTSQTDIQLKISEDGSIKPSGIDKIFIKGLSIKQSKSIIAKRLAKYYDFRSDQLVIRVDGTRTLMVNIFGEVNTQGSFNISALNSAFNALSASGGITQFGSVREIQLIRGNKRTLLDLYEFMKDPSVNEDLSLQNNDIIFVPVAQKIVSIEGAVKRPKRYEISGKETLKDLIAFAGGTNANARPDYVKITRIDDGEEKLFEYDLANVLKLKQVVELKNGDRVNILSIKRPLEYYVDIEGSVYYPGRFDLQSNPTLSKLLGNAQPNYNAKTDLVFIQRTRPDLSVEFLSLPYGDNLDYKLQPRDRVQILDLKTYRDQMEFSVIGSVRKPFSRPLSYGDKLTVSKALEMAGGLLLTANKKAYVFRKNWNNPEKTTYIPVDIASDSLMELGAGDRLNIYDETTFSDFGNIRISGAVRKTLNLSYDSSINLNDLIVNAGGLVNGAAYNRVEVFRVNLSATEQVQFEKIILEVDSNFNLVGSESFQFQPYDHVVVRMTPEFSLGKTVEISGQVKFPGLYVIDNNVSTLNEVIEKAGGLLIDADKNGATLFRTYRNRGDISFDLDDSSKKSDPILFEGDVVNISPLENTVTIYDEGTRNNIYGEDVGITYKNIIYNGKKSAKWYIKQFSGGFLKNADRKSVVVTLPNNQTIGTKRFMGINIYPKVFPGSTIRLKMDNEKQRKSLEPKEKLDIETAFSKSLTTLTSILSVILLVERL